MSPDKIFEVNLELWAQTHPKEAVMLPYLQTVGLHSCTTDLGEPNCYRKDDDRDLYLHPQDGAAKEAAAWLASLELEGVDALYVYGIGLGYYYDVLVPWLRESSDHTVVFIEDDMAVISAFLHTERATALLKDRQVHLIYLADGNVKSDILDDIYWNFALTKAKASALKSYESNKSETFNQLCHEISYSGDLKKALIDEYLSYGVPYFANCYRNLLRLPEGYLGDHLFGRFKGIPAIICGAGPSLEKNASLLRELSDRALIFAGGSAINILNGMDIQPHFCVGIDPNDAQQVRLRSNQAFEVPFFYRQRLNYSAYCTVHAPKLYVTGSGGYDIAEFLEERLGIEGTFFEEGHNVVNFAMELAYQMGCGPIIFVGMDLAFTDKKTYSSGVTFDPSVEQRTLDEYADFENSGLKRKDIFGQPIYTLWKWVAEAEWISSWSKKHPEVVLLNCTEGGIGFPGIENRPLTLAVEEFLGTQRDLKGQIHTEIQNSRMPQVTDETVKNVMNELLDSLRRCANNLGDLIDELDQMKSLTIEQKKPYPYAQSGKGALLEFELFEEPAWAAVLQIFNVVSSCLMNKELVTINRHSLDQEDWQRNVRKMELTQKRLGFLKSVAIANAELITYAFKNREEELIEESRFNATVEKMPLMHVPGNAQKLEFGLDASKQGVWRTYYDDKSLKGECHYSEGKLVGSSIFYDDNGQKSATTNYVDGLKHGEALYYYPDSTIAARLHYDKGQPHGVQTYYYANGGISSELSFEHGKLTGTAKLYFPNGKLKRKIEFE